MASSSDFPKHGVVYMLRHSEDIDNENCYIGSSFDIKDRIRRHKDTAKNRQHKRTHPKLYDFLDGKPLDDWCFIKLDEGMFESDRQLRALENHWIGKLKPTLNCRGSYVEGETKSERCQTYYQHHSEIIKQRSKDYRQSDTYKEKAQDYFKEYREKNREAIAAKRNVSVECEVCKKEVSKRNISRHMKTHKQEM